MNYPVIVEFIIEFIQYADEADIRSFLEFLIHDKNLFSSEEDMYDSNYFKNKFIELLIRHPKHNQLILQHLEGLQYCYNSYKAIFNDDKKTMQLIDIAFAEYNSSKPINPPSITSKDKTKLIHMIIENCITNGFYYFFYNDTLYKWDVTLKKKNKIGFDETTYDLIDEVDATHIVSKNNYVDYNLKYLLPRYDTYLDSVLNRDESKFLTGLNELIRCEDFQKIKNIHNKIVEAINVNKKDYCKCCNPIVNNSKLSKICDNCKNLFEEFNNLNSYLEEWEQYEYEFGIAKIDYKNMIYNIKPDRMLNLKSIKIKRKEKLLNAINMVVKEINKETNSNEIERKSRIEESIDRLESLISKSFDG